MSRTLDEMMSDAIGRAGGLGRLSMSERRILQLRLRWAHWMPPSEVARRLKLPVAVVRAALVALRDRMTYRLAASSPSVHEDPAPSPPVAR